MQAQCDSEPSEEASQQLDMYHAMIPFKNPLNEKDAAAMTTFNVTNDEPEAPPAIGTSGLPIADAGPAPGAPLGTPSTQLADTDPSGTNSSGVSAVAAIIDVAEAPATALSPTADRGGSVDFSDAVPATSYITTDLGMAALTFVVACLVVA